MRRERLREYFNHLRALLCRTIDKKISLVKDAEGGSCECILTFRDTCILERERERIIIMVH